MNHDNMPKRLERKTIYESEYVRPVIRIQHRIRLLT